MEPKYKRILLKVSGEALAGDKKTGLDYGIITDICKSVKKCVDEGVQVAIVVGGGNFWRGRSSGAMDRTRADHIGMLATAMNALALADVIADLAKTHQVIAITHLAQVAVRGDAHYVVARAEDDAGPKTVLNVIEGAEREREIARMLAGSITETSLAHARELLAKARGGAVGMALGEGDGAGGADGGAPGLDAAEPCLADGGAVLLSDSGSTDSPGDVLEDREDYQAIMDSANAEMDEASSQRGVGADQPGQPGQPDQPDKFDITAQIFKSGSRKRILL